MKKYYLIAVSLFVLSNTYAQVQTETKPADGKVALSVDAGTLGYGATGWFTLSPAFTVSAGYNFFSYTASDIDGDSTTFTAKLKLSNVPIILNWHPFKGTFRVFGGLDLADNKIDITGQFAGTTIEIGDSTYTKAQVGDLIGNVKIAKGASGLVGIGWSKTTNKKGFGGFLDLGVVFSGSAKISLVATGPINSNPTFQADVAKEIKDVQDSADKYKIYPLMRFGLLYRF